MPLTATDGVILLPEDYEAAALIGIAIYSYLLSTEFLIISLFLIFLLISSISFSWELLLCLETK